MQLGLNLGQAEQEGNFTVLVQHPGAEQTARTCLVIESNGQVRMLRAELHGPKTKLKSFLLGPSLDTHLVLVQKASLALKPSATANGLLTGGVQHCESGEVGRLGDENVRHRKDAAQGGIADKSREVAPELLLGVVQVLPEFLRNGRSSPGAGRLASFRGLLWPRRSGCPSAGRSLKHAVSAGCW